MTVFNDADAKTQNSTLSERPDTHKGEESQAVSASQARFEALEARYAALEALVAKKATSTATPKLTRPWPFGLRSLKLALATVIGLSAVLAAAENFPGSSVPATLTYEGYLEVDGKPAGDSYDMEITLHRCEDNVLECDLEVPKTWVFDAVDLGQVEVAAGRFAVELTGLDESHFDERELWVAVKVGDVELDGRQKLNSVPFAVKARNADNAANAANAATLGGEAAAHVLGSIVPIGAITAWHKDLVGTPEIPNNWAECNGQLLEDEASPYDKTNLPNLNLLHEIEGELFRGLFLRGGVTSGILQADATAKNGLSVAMPDLKQQDFSTGNRNAWHGDGYGEDVNNIVSHDTETRPANMSVVWIIRIK
jgi:hypothetical protein